MTIACGKQQARVTRAVAAATDWSCVNQRRAAHAPAEGRGFLPTDALNRYAKWLLREYRAGGVRGWRIEELRYSALPKLPRLRV